MMSDLDARASTTSSLHDALPIFNRDGLGVLIGLVICAVGLVVAGALLTGAFHLGMAAVDAGGAGGQGTGRSEGHTAERQSREKLVSRLELEITKIARAVRSEILV